MPCDNTSPLSFCLYYKGEAACPFTEAYPRIFWTIEREWVNCPAAPDGQIPVLINKAMTAYFDAGLGTFHLDDKTPISLKAYIYFRIKTSEPSTTADSTPASEALLSKFAAIYDIYIQKSKG